jgi:hypothetical protein
MERAHEKRVILRVSLDQEEPMEQRILSSGAIAAVAGAAMLVTASGPADAFTVSSPSLEPAVAAAGVEPAYWGRLPA